MLETEPQLIEQYIKTGTVKLVYRHLVQLGDRSLQLAEASECAADQGKFWPMRQAIYARYNQMLFDTEQELAAAAADADVDLAQLNACLDAATHRAAVQADHDAATAEGIRSRPVFRLGERTLIGAQPFTVFQDLIAQASGR
nr:thioredoxin domain-containing protein [Candidatus Chloroploca sp. Khr17]